MPIPKPSLADAIEASDVANSAKLFNRELSRGEDVLRIHDSLFPVVQRVMNPPFINPHLPKMYRICRELFPYLEKDDIPSLVSLEIGEYARRDKVKIIPKRILSSSVSFNDIESAIRDRNPEETAHLIAAFHVSKGPRELARRLLLVGSGYLDHSLGHSVSCTAFILLEAIERLDQEPWPALATLADYFCKGGYNETPTMRMQKRSPSEDLAGNLLRAASGRGIVNLHHTITLYAIEHARMFFMPQEIDHMIGSWRDFLGDKKAEPFPLEASETKASEDYTQFYRTFSRLETQPVVSYLVGMLDTESSRRQLGRFLIKGLCNLYQGDYDPHYLTGLGSALWAVAQYWRDRQTVATVLYQYLDFLFQNLV